MSKVEIFLVQHNDGRRVAFVLKDGRLVANTLPAIEPKEEILSRLISSDKYLDKIVHVELSSHPISDLLFQLDKAPQEHWKDACELDIDYHYYSSKQQQVFETLRKTQPGETISYGDLAKKSNMPNAARFVGNCMATNHMPMILPCHRVVRADGSLGNYSAHGGTSTKQRYLELEGAI